jgi:hypothetical protein
VSIECAVQAIAGDNTLYMLNTFRTLFLLATLSLSLAACQKELSFAEDAQNDNDNPEPGGGGQNVNLEGVWRFVGMQGQTGTSIEMSQGGQSTRSEALLNFVAEDPEGTVQFVNNEMVLTDVGYLMSGTTTARTYLNGQLLNSVDQPAAAVTPPTSSSSAYTRIGGDSLRFDETPVMVPTGPGMPGSSVDLNAGARLRKSNDTLYLRMLFNENVPLPDPTIPGNMRIFGDMEMALVK